MMIDNVVSEAGKRGMNKWLYHADAVGYNYLSLPLIPA